MIRRLLKWTFRLLILGIVLVVILGFGRNTFLRLLLERRLERATGLETTVGRAYLDWYRPVIRLQHVRLFNPPELGGKPFLDIPELKARYDVMGLFSQRFLVRELELHISEIRMVRREADQSTQGLLIRQRAKAGPLVGAILVDPLTFVGVEHLILSAEHYLYSDQVEIQRSQDLSLDIRDLSVRQLQNRGDWLRLWEQLTRAKGIRPPPMPPPPLALPAADGSNRPG